MGRASVPGSARCQFVSVHRSPAPRVPSAKMRGSVWVLCADFEIFGEKVLAKVFLLENEPTVPAEQVLQSAFLLTNFVYVLWTGAAASR